MKNMDLQSQISNKLREAGYFLGKLESVANSGQSLDGQEFQYLLSAFLSACYSCVDPLGNRQYRKWYQGWLDLHSIEERQVISFILGQRRAEAHRSGAKLRSKTVFKPISEIRVEQRGHPAYGFHSFGPPGTPLTQIGIDTKFFRKADSEIEAVEICKKFLVTITILESDFRKDHILE
jgi:hypothetical protein